MHTVCFYSQSKDRSCLKRW